MLNILALHITGFLVSRNLQTAKYITQGGTNRKARWKSVTSPTAHKGLGETWEESCFYSPPITRAPLFSHRRRRSDLRHQSQLTTELFGTAAIGRPLLIQSPFQHVSWLNPKWIPLADSSCQVVLLPKHTHVYATIIEVGMVATQSAPSRSTYNRINQLPESTCKVLEQLCYSHQERLLPLHNKNQLEPRSLNFTL
jgi:hypothetical protein